MTWTADDLIAIDATIKSGSLRVKYADREVQYRSLDELMRIRNLIIGETAVVPSSGLGGFVYVGFDKGLR
ncbi:MAG: hypothetical protein ABI120_17495 [Gemmatimonadaceae bacterium]